ncbi:hypothetical protein F5Y13DRAFT_197987 [Hypoxylon sp. FL1857]|nr:hypothetical protein F5Y13DRAFT_197987 [Hypoxylon sp. FL1857]
MSRLELLPQELRDMIIQESFPRDILALISASPTYLQDFQHGRARILRKYINMQADHHVDIALGIVNLRAHRRQLAEYDYRTRGQVLVDYLRDGIEGGYDKRPLGPLRGNLPFIAQVLELQDEARRLASRLALNVLPMIQTLESSRLTNINHQSPEQAPWDEAHRVERGVLIFEMYCLSLTVSDGDLTPEVSRYWRPFFTKRLGIWASASHDEFFATYHCVLEEHKRIVREVARDLGVAETPTTEWGATAANTELWEARMRDGPWDGAGRPAQIRFLDKRTGIDEYSYCRYLASLGIGLMNRLAEMTQKERNDYTLVHFSHFCEVQVEVAWRAAPMGLSAFMSLNKW